MSLAVIGPAFLGGVVSSFGPCVAPRYVLVTALLSRGATVGLKSALVAGTLSGYLVYALAGEMLARSGFASHAIYSVLAMMLVTMGIMTMTRRAQGCASRMAASNSLGSTFLLGGLGALTFSPCCTPIALGLGVEFGAGSTADAAAALLAFGAGHSLPPVAGALGVLPAIGRNASPVVGRSSTIVAAALLIALGAFYGLLA